MQLFGRKVDAHLTQPPGYAGNQRKEHLESRHSVNLTIRRIMQDNLLLTKDLN